MNRFAVASAVAGVALLIAGQVLMSRVGGHLGYAISDLYFILKLAGIVILLLAACGILIGLFRRDKGERSATLSGLAWTAIGIAVLGFTFNVTTIFESFGRIGTVPKFDVWSPSLVEGMVFLAVGLLAAASIAAFNGRKT